MVCKSTVQQYVNEFFGKLYYIQLLFSNKKGPWLAVGRNHLTEYFLVLYLYWVSWAVTAQLQPSTTFIFSSFNLGINQSHFNFFFLVTYLGNVAWQLRIVEGTLEMKIIRDVLI